LGKTGELDSRWKVEFENETMKKFVVGNRDVLSFRGAALSNTQQCDATKVGFKVTNINLDLEIPEDPAARQRENRSRDTVLKRF